VLIIIAVDGQRATAQDDRLYAGVSGVLSTQGSPPPGGDSQAPDLPRNGVGGTALGVSGEFGGFLMPRLSLSFEVSVPARFESVQEIDYYTISRTDSQHRDLFHSGLFHVHFAEGRTIQVAAVAGPTVVQENTLVSTAYQVRPQSFVRTGVFGPYGPQITLSRWTVGITGGVDLGIQLSHRVQVMPQVRVHWIQRASLNSFPTPDNAFLGLSALVIRPAVGLRVAF
jgi:hypothetical protein